MHPRRSFPIILAAALALVGCQTPKHSNVLIFGTNTRGGIDVGYDPKLQTGGILVGWQRQEAVWMPLLANTNADASAPYVPNTTTTNNGTTTTTVAPTAVAEALFTGKDGEKTDTYSVIASVGAKFNANTGNQTSAGGGISQFFATGLAARTLAIKGADLLSLPSDEVAKARQAEAAAQLAETNRMTASLTTQRTVDDELQQKFISYLASATDAQVSTLVTDAKAATLVAADAAVSTPAEQRAALRKGLKAYDDPKRLLSLRGLAAKHNL